MIKRKESRPEVIPVDTPDYGQKAASVVRSGGVIAFPTETYYGLGVDPFNAKSVRHLFELKKRSFNKAVLVIIHDLFQLDRLVMEVPEPYETLMRKHWPGPLTLIFPALPNLSELLTGRTGTIGIRMSSSTIATNICQSAGGALTATSANISGRPPASNADEVIEYFGEKIDLTVDGGPASVRKCSTIIGIDHERLTLIRPGILPIHID